MERKPFIQVWLEKVLCLPSSCLVQVPQTLSWRGGESPCSWSHSCVSWKLCFLMTKTFFHMIRESSHGLSQKQSFNSNEVQSISVFLFIVHIFYVKSKNSLPGLSSWRFSPISFMFYIYIVYDPVWVIYEGVKVNFFCLWMWNCFSKACWIGYPSSIKLLLHICQKSIGHICVGLFLDSLFCPCDLCIYPSTNTSVSWLMELYSKP